MKIGIAGIGGIGSNVARHIAQAGIGTVRNINFIKIVDFDCVEVSNLNRQFYKVSQAGLKKTDSLEINLKQINPDMVIEKIDKQLCHEDMEEIFSDCDIIVEGFDEKLLKKMIIEKFSETKKIIVSASGIAGNNLDAISIKKMGNCYIVGDFVSDQDDHELFPPKIATIAAMMADIVLKAANNKDSKE